MIDLHTGDRAELATLFRLADGSACAIAGYRDLGDVSSRADGVQLLDRGSWQRQLGRLQVLVEVRERRRPRDEQDVRRTLQQPREFDPRFTRLGARPTERAYLAQDHVVVSYNGDLRGFIEDSFGRDRRVRCSVATFAAIGAIVDGSSLVATVPAIVAISILHRRRHLRMARLPFPRVEGGLDLLWPAVLDTDDACRFLREAIVELVDRLPDDVLSV